VPVELVFELSDVRIVKRDRWEVATIEWPCGRVAGL
jgi:hypothetical protein